MFRSSCAFALFFLGCSASDLREVLQAEETCCPSFESESDCSAFGTCVWLEQYAGDKAADKIMSERSVKCVGENYYACVASDAPCCGAACFPYKQPEPPADCSVPYPVTPKPTMNPTNRPTSSPSTAPTDYPSASPTVSFEPVYGSPPQNLGYLIGQSRVKMCQPKFKNCLEEGDTVNYSPNKFLFLGAEKKLEYGCCYEYVTYFNDMPDCLGQKPPQDYSILGIDCPNDAIDITYAGFRLNDMEYDYTYTSMTPEYGPDQDTCFEGAKLQFNCPYGKECSYAICMKFPSEVESCPTGPTWVMNKAGGAFSFLEIEGPSCPVYPANNQNLAAAATAVSSEQASASILSANSMRALAAVAAFLVLAAIYKVYTRKASQDAKYMPLSQDEQVTYGSATQLA